VIHDWSRADICRDHDAVVQWTGLGRLRFERGKRLHTRLNDVAISPAWSTVLEVSPGPT
jgi:hypothetical protein